MAKNTKKSTTGTNKKTASSKKSAAQLSEDHWSKRRSKPRDTSKKIFPAEIDTTNMVSKPRARKEINYRDLQLGRSLKKVNRESANVLEKRQANPTKKITKQSKTTSSKKSSSKK